MTNECIILLFVSFFIKHFVVDFPLQKWQYLWGNKHNWKHPGGYIHAGLHFAGTFLLLSVVGVNIALAFFLSLIDFASHYLIDNGKMNLCKKMNWKPQTSPWFYYALGFDQMLHYFVYAFIIWMVTR